MEIKAYNPKNGDLLANDISGIDFGEIIQGEHSSVPVLIRPIMSDDNVSNIRLLLASNGGFDDAHYGYLLSDQFTPDVESYNGDVKDGVHYISDHFENPSTAVSDAIQVGLDSEGVGDFIWLDVQPGEADIGRSKNLTYRFIFDYN